MKMKDVAMRAGVSLTTVSRVVNGDPIVQPQFRERVLRAMKELEYKPNRLASNLRHQKSAMIGVVISDVANPHFAQLVRAIEDIAYLQGYRVLVCNTDERAEKQHAYLEVLAAERVAGVMISPVDLLDQELEEILALGIPLIALDREIRDPRADAVLMNNVEGAHRATQLLIATGHQRIGLVAGTVDIQSGAERLMGYELAMREAGLEAHVVRSLSTAEQGASAVEHLLEQPLVPTALVVANNLLAEGVCKTLRQRGLRIPEQMALVVIDDPTWAELVEPPLTALAQPIQQLAASAVALLLERITEQRQEPKRIVLEFEVHLRCSC